MPLTLKQLQDVIQPLVDQVGELQAQNTDLIAEVAAMRAEIRELRTAPVVAAAPKRKAVKGKRKQSDANRLALFLQRGNGLDGDVEIDDTVFDQLIAKSTDKTAEKLRENSADFISCNTWQEVVDLGRDVVGKNLALSFVHRLAVITGDVDMLMEQVPAAAPAAARAAPVDTEDSEDDAKPRKARVAHKDTRHYKGGQLFQQVMAVVDSDIKTELVDAALENELTDSKGNVLTKRGAVLNGAIYRLLVSDDHQALWDNAGRDLPNNKSERQHIVRDSDLVAMWNEHARAILADAEEVGIIGVVE